MKNKQTICEQLRFSDRTVIFSDLKKGRVSHISYWNGFFLKIPTDVELYYRFDLQRYSIRNTVYFHKCPPSDEYILDLYPEEVLERFAWNCLFYAKILIKEIQPEEHRDKLYYAEEAVSEYKNCEDAIREKKYQNCSFHTREIAYCISKLRCDGNITDLNEKIRQSRFLMKLLTRWEKKHEKII